MNVSLAGFDEYGSMSADGAGSHPVSAGRYNESQISSRLDDIIASLIECKRLGDERGAPKTERQSDRTKAMQEPGLQRQRFGFHRGCEWGLCCVYSMWYDPMYKCPSTCTHTHRFRRASPRTCGPSLLEDSVRSRAFEEYRRRNSSPVEREGAQWDPTLHFKALRKKARSKRSQHCNQKGNPDAEDAKMSGLPRPYDRIPPIRRRASSGVRRRGEASVKAL